MWSILTSNCSTEAPWYIPRKVGPSVSVTASSTINFSMTSDTSTCASCNLSAGELELIDGPCDNISSTITHVFACLEWNDFLLLEARWQACARYLGILSVLLSIHIRCGRLKASVLWIAISLLQWTIFENALNLHSQISEIEVLRYIWLPEWIIAATSYTLVNNQDDDINIIPSYNCIISYKICRK